MAKAIDKNNVWYQEVAPRSFYKEEDLERVIIQNLEIIFPHFKALPFKKKLFDSARNKSNTPDLVMIKADYSEWYIIEVELGKHDKKHVLEQIETFYNCSYTDDHASYIFNKRRRGFNLNSLKTLIATQSPKLMVIVNEPKDDWKEDLKSFRCMTCIFQIYQDFEGKALYRLNGEHPYIYTNFCHCKYEKVGYPFTVEVLQTDFLDGYGILNGEKISIEFGGVRLQWERVDGANRVFLNCDYTRPPLDPLTDRYRLNYDNILKSYSFTKD